MNTPKHVNFEYLTKMKLVFSLVRDWSHQPSMNTPMHMDCEYLTKVKSKKISNDQELIQSDPTSDEVGRSHF